MINPAKKTVIFDFGNILINLDHKKCFDSFQKTLGVDFSGGLPPKTKEILHRFDRGNINTEDFLLHFQHYKPDAEERDIIGAWNDLLAELPMSRFEMIAGLRSKYNIVMLSNINELHIEKIHRDLNKHQGIDDFHSDYFDKVYYSCRIGMRKPDLEIYNFVTEDLNVTPTDILFIDDLAENIAACKTIGWNGAVHNPKEDIINNIDIYLKQTGWV